MKRYIFLILLLCMLIPMSAQADEQVRLGFNAPTLNCDDSNLVDLAGYVVRWWYQSTPGTLVELDVDLDGSPELDGVGPESVVVTLVGNVEGRTVLFQGVSKDTSGNLSDDPGGCGPSNLVSVPFAVTFPRAMDSMTGTQL